MKVWEDSKKLWKHSPAARVPTGFLVLPNFHLCLYLTIRLWARDFYEVIVDEAEGRINYRLIEIESEWSNCFSRILTEINSNNCFHLFFYALLSFTLKQSCTYWTDLGKFAVVYARTRYFKIFKFFKSRNRKCASFSFLRNLITRLHLNFLPKPRKNYKNMAFWGRPAANCTLMADSIRVAQPIRLLHLH